MAKLTTEHRNELSDKQFAVPSQRAYPIFDRSHAQNALARVSQYGTSDLKAKVTAAVHRKYPDMGKE